SPGAPVEWSNWLGHPERCYSEKSRTEWATKLEEIFPAREKILETDAPLYERISAQNDEALELVEKSSQEHSFA
ncbi:malate:quinone oxidoreductase, partial [Pseudomonas syringae]